jgi:hypothetical protein
LFARVTQGWYQFNPALEIRCRDADQSAWRPVLAALNLPLIHEFALEHSLPRIESYLAAAGLPSCAVPVALERRRAQQQRAAQRQSESHEPRWGTPQARQREMQRLQQRIDALRKSET